MALTFGFYNSVGGDRRYDSEDFATFFDGLVTDGVLPTSGGQFQVTADGTRVRVASGRAWFNKTWSYDGENSYFDLVPSSSVNNRIDTLVLDIDKSAAVRENKIIWVTGTPSATPVAPSLIRTEERNQYALANVLRPRDVETVTSAQITSRIGSPDCPFATNTLTNIEQSNVIDFKRSFSRGNNLGSVFTTDQRAAIKSGTFDGLYLGDYWTFNGVRWRIVDFDYWWNTLGGDINNQVRIREHHVVIVPDSTSTISPRSPRFTNIRDSNNCGWGNSSSAKTIMTNIMNQSAGLFGSNNFIKRITGVYYAMQGNPFYMDTRSEGLFATPMSELQLIGSINIGVRSNKVLEDHKQFALYKLDSLNIYMGGWTDKFWLTGNFDYQNGVVMTTWGLDIRRWNPLAPDANYYERPVFAVMGN